MSLLERKLNIFSARLNYAMLESAITIAHNIHTTALSHHHWWFYGVMGTYARGRFDPVSLSMLFYQRNGKIERERELTEWNVIWILLFLHTDEIRLGKRIQFQNVFKRIRICTVFEYFIYKVSKNTAYAVLCVHLIFLCVY